MCPGLSEAVSLLLVLLAYSAAHFPALTEASFAALHTCQPRLDILTGVRLGRWVFKKRVYSVCMCVRGCAPQSVCGGQRTIVWV